MIQLNVIPTNAAGAQVPAPIITLFVADAAGRPCPIEPAIRVQTNFYSADSPYTPGGFTKPFTVYGTVQAAGFATAYFGPLPWDGATTLNIPVSLAASFKKPTRAQACSIRRHFQGLTVHSTQYGDLPWFDPVLISFDGELDNILDQLIAAGDTHCSIAPFWDYGEAGQPWGTGQLVPGRDWWTNPADRPKYLAVVDRVIRKGLIPIFILAGEGSPDWIRANLHALVALLRQGYDRTAYGPFYVVYDGVWPAAWSVQQMKDTIPWIRSVIGDSAYLGFMFACGPAGNPYFYVEDEGDYHKPWMQALDFVMMSTQPDQAQCPALVNGLQYLIGPALHDTAECQRGWIGPWLMAPGTPRGPYFGGFDEWAEYQWVRNQLTAAQIAADQARMESVGIQNHG